MNNNVSEAQLINAVSTSVLDLHLLRLLASGIMIGKRTLSEHQDIMQVEYKCGHRLRMQALKRFL